MRGKPSRCTCGFWVSRNIPAYAGKTRPCSIMGSNWSEHPRVCGENLHAGDKRQVRGGTSPRMRGKRSLVVEHTAATRNIPAYAGKTYCDSRCAAFGEEHPRVCGENPVGVIRVYPHVGTSPRMRGKRGHSVPDSSPGGNIPAYAGKTTPTQALPPTNKEHPRVCGENFFCFRPGIYFCGTSPRMRGKPDFFKTGHAFFRNIPAYAGKTKPA